MPVLIRGGGAPDKSKGLTATAATILAGKTALVGGQVVVGTLKLPTLREQTVGSIVKAEVGGVLRNFIVVHQGKPSSIYSRTFDNSTILLMEEIYETHQWHTSNINSYSASTIHSYLNSTFLNLCAPVIKNNVKQVRIPYRAGYGADTTVTSGESGLACKIWLPSGYEVGFTTADSQYFAEDGAKFNFFFSGTEADANTKRIGYLNGSATRWWLRSPCCGSGYSYTRAWNVFTSGIESHTDCSNSYGIRPAFTLPGTMIVLPDGTLVG